MNIIKTICLAKYQLLITAIINNNHALAIIDQSGDLLISQITEQSIDIAGKLDFIKAELVSEKRVSDEIKIYSLDNSQQLFLKTLTLGSAQKIYGFLLLVENTPTAIESDTRNVLSKTIDAIGALITEDYLQQATISGMLTEVTNRYEELNLFYGLDDPIKEQNQENESIAIKTTLRKLIHTLQVESAGFAQPGKETYLVSQERKTNTETYGFMRQDKMEKICHHLKTSKKTCTINTIDDQKTIFEGDELQHKLLFCHVKSEQNNTFGLFFVVRNRQQPDFTNSDQKLCEIVVSQIARSLQFHRDPLTGLLNRQGFSNLFNHARSRLDDQDSHSVLLYMNLDRFKILNETFGQEAGNQVLKQIAALIKKTIRRDDTAARFSADEFVILFDCNLAIATKRAQEIQRILESFRYPYKNKHINITVRMGLVDITQEVETLDQAVTAGEVANQLAKRSVDHRIRVFKQNDHDLVKYESDMVWANRIEESLIENRFCLYHQAIAPVQSPRERFNHYEILLRLEGKDGKIISPGLFIPVAEKFGLMPKIDRWVIHKALSGLPHQSDDIKISINLSGQSLSDDSLSSYILQEIAYSGVDPKRLCFEITETIAIANLDHALELISVIKERGCSFSLDDFGSGMSSFGYLRNLPVDYVKIDGSFVKRIVDDPIDYTMVESINKVAHYMGLKTVAEFVENEKILQTLDKLGVDYAQGWELHKPEPFATGDFTLNRAAS
ncbi:MAG: EAL domain-containing protein [Methylococcales bacterium]